MALRRGFTMDERVSSLFQPDTLIPEQFQETFRRLTHLEPEKRLMLAVLEDGVACFQKYAAARDGRGKTIFKETEEWILGTSGEWLFSFPTVCESLGLDSDYLRKGLLRWKMAQMVNREPARVYELVPRSDPPTHRLRKAAG